VSAQVCRKVQQALQQQPTIGQVQEEEGQKEMRCTACKPSVSTLSVGGWKRRLAHQLLSRWLITSKVATLNVRLTQH